MDKKEEKQKLELRGGIGGAITILVIGLVFLVIAALQHSKIIGYAVAFLIALIVGIFFAKDEKQYANAIVGGLTKPMFATIALAVLLASIAGSLVSQSGLIGTLAVIAIKLGLTGKFFVAVTFIITCLVSFSTGTSVGTYFVIIPILYPAGILIGADPAFLIGAIAAGAAFGDNLAPISDTTIASAYTQEMDIGGVVKSRMKYSIVVGIIALFLYLFFGPAGPIIGEYEAKAFNLVSLVMLVIPAVIVALALFRKHLITALSVGLVTGIITSLIFGIFKPTQLLDFPKAFTVEGLIPSSILGVMPTILFLMVIFPLLGVMENSGTLDRLGSGFSKLAKSPRKAEASIVGSVGILTMVTGVTSAAIISLGDMVKDLGKRFKIDGYRRANLMDCAGATFCFIVPWTVHAIIPTMLAKANAPIESAKLISPATVCLHNFYSWTMLVMLIFAIITGYGRTFLSDATAHEIKKTVNKEEL
jgi:Na+/H+ antiporter NhaC